MAGSGQAHPRDAYQADARSRRDDGKGGREHEKSGPERVGRVGRAHSRRIQILRIVLILTIVAVHIPPAAWDSLQPTYSPDWFLFCKVFFNRIFSRSAVPALSAISGYLVFTGIATVPYRRLMASKCKSLLWPLLFWNGVVLLAAVLLARHGSGMIASPDHLDPWGVLNALLGIAAPPINFPLAFLRDLFACAALSPLLWFVLKRAPWVGLCVLALIAIADLPIWIVQRQAMLLCFYLGGLVVLKRWNLNGLDRWAPQLAGAYLVCALALTWLICRDPAAILAHNVYADEVAYLGVMTGALKALGVPAFWALSSLLERASFSDFLVRASRFSFLIYCAHMPTMQLLWRVWMRLVGDQAAPSYPVFYFGAPAMAVVLIVFARKVLDRFARPLLGLIEGGRVHRLSTTAQQPGAAPEERRNGLTRHSSNRA